MANNLNTVTVVGNLTRDPELKFIPSGQAVTKFGIAVNRSWKKDDEWQEETSFLDVSVWREQGENVAESLRKGDRVLVSGRIEQRSWETTEGEKRSKVEIQAEEVAPSLRFATAAITRNERIGGSTPARPKAAAPPAPDYDDGAF